MPVRIRLTRVGATKRPSYRVIAIDKRQPRDGRALEILGYYDPLTEPATVSLQTDKINAWIGKGAQPSETVLKLMRQAERQAQEPAETPKPKRATRATKPKASKSAKTADATPDEAAEAPSKAADASTEETAAQTEEATEAPSEPADTTAEAEKEDA